MKKNISINLFGTLYAIDEDAYNLLERYLDSMKSYFSSQQGGDEIADDIEHRVAELLWQEKENGAEAVNIDMIKDIIGKIGDPAQIDGNQDENENIPSDEDGLSSGFTSSDAEDSGSDSRINSDGQNYDRSDSANRGESVFQQMRSNMRGRRLYRDIADKMLGGVCSGLARYAGGDVTVWRIGTIVLALLLWSIDWWWIPGLVNWLVPLAYIVLWVCVPVARTPEDRLRMRGADVNPQNINEEILNETNVQASQAYGQHNQGRTNNNDGCLKLLGGGCLVVLLFPFLMVMLMLLFAAPIFGGVLNSGLFGSVIPVGDEGLFSSLMQSMQGMLWAVLLCGFFVLLIPIVLIVRWLRGSSKPLSTTALVVLIILWFAALLGGIYYISHNLGDLVKKGIEYDNSGVYVSVENLDINGIHYADQEEYRWVCQNDWEIVKAENCHRVTSCGEYYYADSYAPEDWDEEYDETRYLDSYNSNEKMNFIAQQSQCVTPGIYRLRAATRASMPGASIFAGVSAKKMDVQGAWGKFCPIIAYGNTGGPLWKWAKGNKDIDPVKENIPVDEIDDYHRQLIANANGEEGFGWAFTVIDNIEVKDTMNLYYGVTTDYKFGAINSNCEWFSATDFKLEKIGELKK